MTTGDGPAHYVQRWSWLLLVLTCATSCSVLLDPTNAQCDVRSDCEMRRGLSPATCIDHVCVPLECVVDEECSARGLSSAVCHEGECQLASALQASGPWACLGDVRWPTSSEPRPVLTVRVVDVITTAPPQGLGARLCPKLDIDCDNALAGSFELDDQAQLKLSVPAGFDGYVELTAPSITPALLFVTQPIWEDTTLDSVLPVVSNEGFQGIAQAIGTTLNLTTFGHAYALASDCEGTAAAGVRFETQAKTASTASYYMINNVPVGSASQTDASGSGGFLNLETGFTQIIGYVADTGARIGEAGFIVRPGAVSYPRVVPTP